MSGRRLIGLLGAVALVLVLAGLWARSRGPGQSAAPASSAAPAAAQAGGPRFPIFLSGGDEVQGGHVRWRLIGGRIDRHADRADGAPETLALRLSLRVTETMAIDTRISSDGVRLLASGRQFSATKPVNVPLFASQSADLIDLVFVVPPDLKVASLQLATIDGSSALMPLALAR